MAYVEGALNSYCGSHELRDVHRFYMNQRQRDLANYANHCLANMLTYPKSRRNVDMHDQAVVLQHQRDILTGIR
eukprot:5741398-Pyramimonas_sp.AAC.1